METRGDHGACISIGVVADLLGVTEQTLRLYESQGLVKPLRRNRERHYRAGDVQWLECLRRLIHTEKVSIEGVKRLLHFAPCWEIIGFPQEVQCSGCPVYREHSGGPVVNGESRRAVTAE
jgi:MerR family transcriptional regulator/heat shock protein HspR